MTHPLTATIHKSIRGRLRAFKQHVSQSSSALSDPRSRLALVHHLFAHFADQAIDDIDQILSDDEIGEENQLSSMRRVSEQVFAAVKFFDDRFQRGANQLPRSLVASVERACQEFGEDTVVPILTLGPPGDFRTVVTDLKTVLFSTTKIAALPHDLRDFKPVFIAIPEMEATRPIWDPITVGHELAHYFQDIRPVTYSFNINDLVKDENPLDLTLDQQKQIPSEAHTRRFDNAQRLRVIATSWLSEVACDAYAVLRYGPSAFAAISEFLESVGATTFDDSPTHPAGSIRASLMLQWIAASADGIDHEIVDPFIPLASAVEGPAWSVALGQILIDHADIIWSDIKTWVTANSRLEVYALNDRSLQVLWLADLLKRGIPGADTYTRQGKPPVEILPADIITANWLANIHGVETPVNRLTSKALENLEFVRLWRDNGGHLADYRTDEGEDDDDEGEPSGAVLSAESILKRLSTAGPKALIVTPRLPESIQGVGLDVRLGNKFILFHQSSAPSFDPLDREQDPRSMQFAVEKDWGEPFHLHPGQLVLAATLEYIAMPADLTAQLVTRSSYGRLGLLSATAVQVHPRFFGCLTLELVNLGEMPLSITPGERIAQLTFQKVDRSVKSRNGDKYRYPTDPEFSKLSRDDESDILRKLARNHLESRQTPYHELASDD